MWGILNNDMQLQLTILFASVFLVLTWNAILLWSIRQALRRANDRLDENRVWYTHLGETLRSSIHVAEGTTARLALVSSRLRIAVQDVSEIFDRVDNWARYGLAKLDFNSGRASETVRGKTRRFASQLGDALYKTAAAIQGLRAVLSFIAHWKVGGVGQAARGAVVPGPVGTTLILLRGLTALSDLLESRRDGTREIEARPE